jgi:hypothetical protein
VQGITSYKHLNEVILDVLKVRYKDNLDNERKQEMAAREIQDRIVSNYKTDKVRINGVKIAKRLKGRDNVSIRYGKDGLCYYRYCPD